MSENSKELRTNWLDFYGSEKENRNVKNPKINSEVEFKTTNGLILKGKFVDRHSVGVFWVYNWGYFSDEKISEWRYFL